MNIRLFCSRSIRQLLTENLTARGFVVGEKGEVALVERGQEEPDQGVVIIFSPENLEHLTVLFDTLAGRREGLRQVIGGWRESKDTYELIPHEQILYFEALGNLVYIVTSDQRLIVKFKLYELENSLRPKGFIRISKSFLVNIANVREIIPWFGGRYIIRLAGNKEMEVSRTYAKDFRTFLEI
jgi:DNA-binding LytR/AlgR family response regulator